MKDLQSFYYSIVKYPINFKDIKKLENDFHHQLKDESTDTKQFVYLFYNPVTKLSKIGITGNTKTRIRSLVNACGIELYYLAALQIEIGYDESVELIEKLLHHFFKEKRKLGEWFTLNIKDMIQIVRLFDSIGGWNTTDNLKYYLLKDNTNYELRTI